MTAEFLRSLGIEDEAAATILERFEKVISEITEMSEKKRLFDKYEAAVFSALKSAGAKNIRACRAVLSHEWDGGDFEISPSGLDGAVSELTKNMPYLFGSDEGKHFYPLIGIVPAEAVDTDGGLERLSYSEYMRLYKN